MDLSLYEKYIGKIEIDNDHYRYTQAFSPSIMGGGIVV